ncbi:hypothetical protein [Mycobacterium sp.]|uniref:hypothetical protein n=1 Tax=Mycobacterium sp. TaxID=1785 RepID=UPI0025E06F7F|nr:hypothetical protein [Mycobacterium sp.]MBW0011715.1 hypothetical protein [Mycobacterium sp.]
MAEQSGATVIFLESHPLWAAARRQEEERRSSMRRHPSHLRRARAAASGEHIARNFKVYSGTDSPA